MTPAQANGVDPGWLRLRGTADARARDTFTAGLVADLDRHLAARLSDGDRDRDGDDDGARDGVARLVDVGAGTAAGARWLRERLAVEQDWRLVDHDHHVLAAAPSSVRHWARGIVAGVEDLGPLLAEESAHVVTCQALLDVLTGEQLDALLDAAVRSGAAVLLSLSVTGHVTLSPAHADDTAVAEAFDAHQRRDGRLGPDGGTYAAEALRREGYAVTTVETPWHLDAPDAPLIDAWLDGRAAAAEEQKPDLAEPIRQWLDARRATVSRGRLRAVVGHVDVLGLPPGSGVGR